MLIIWPKIKEFLVVGFKRQSLARAALLVLLNSVGWAFVDTFPPNNAEETTDFKLYHLETNKGEAQPEVFESIGNFADLPTYFICIHKTSLFFQK